MTGRRTVLLDTNVVLRYLLRDNEEMYRQASMFLEQVRLGQRRALLLEGVVMECVYVLTKFYKVPRDEAVDKLQGILRYKGIRNADRDDLITALDVFGQKSIDFVDCILQTRAKSTDAEVFSFDKDV